MKSLGDNLKIQVYIKLDLGFYIKLESKVDTEIYIYIHINNYIHIFNYKFF